MNVRLSCKHPWQVGAHTLLCTLPHGHLSPGHVYSPSGLADALRDALAQATATKPYSCLAHAQAAQEPRCMWCANAKMRRAINKACSDLARIGYSEDLDARIFAVAVLLADSLNPLAESKRPRKAQR